MLFGRRTQYNEYVHPFACVDDLFSIEELDKIINYCESEELQPAMVISGSKEEEPSVVNTDIRVSKVSFFSYNKDENEWLFKKLWEVTDKVNRETFQFDLQGFNSVQYTTYKGENSRYDFHTDMTTGKRSVLEYLPRKLSFSLVLNDPESFTGGDFQFYFGGPSPDTIHQKRGRLIVFPSFNVHRVSPIKTGERKSLVWWAVGPRFM